MIMDDLCLEEYQNLVDWYYENEYSEKTLYEDLYPLKLMATADVEKIIEKSYNENLHITDTARKVQEVICFYKMSERGM